MRVIKTYYFCMRGIHVAIDIEEIREQSGRMEAHLVSLLRSLARPIAWKCPRCRREQKTNAKTERWRGEKTTHALPVSEYSDIDKGVGWFFYIM